MPCNPAKHSSEIALNAAPVKSIVARSIARRMRSGMLVGPGVMKKCQPCVFAIASSFEPGAPVRAFSLLMKGAQDNRALLLSNRQSDSPASADRRGSYVNLNKK